MAKIFKEGQLTYAVLVRGRDPRSMEYGSHLEVIETVGTEDEALKVAAKFLEGAAKRSQAEGSSIALHSPRAYVAKVYKRVELEQPLPPLAIMDLVEETLGG